jgi:hypothetical protein
MLEAAITDQAHGIHLRLHCCIASFFCMKQYYKDFWKPEIHFPLALVL